MGESGTELKDKQCVPCQGGIPPMTGEEIDKMQAKIGADWDCVNEHHLEKTFRFSDFREALAFTNRVGELAEQEGHHPDLLLSYGEVKVSIHTHKIHGLTESDFILAAKIDALDESA